MAAAPFALPAARHVVQGSLRSYRGRLFSLSSAPSRRGNAGSHEVWVCVSREGPGVLAVCVLLEQRLQVLAPFSWVVCLCCWLRVVYVLDARPLDVRLEVFPPSWGALTLLAVSSRPCPEFPAGGVQFFLCFRCHG